MKSEIASSVDGGTGVLLLIGVWRSPPFGRLCETSLARKLPRGSGSTGVASQRIPAGVSDSTERGIKSTRYLKQQHMCSMCRLPGPFVRPKHETDKVLLKIEVLASFRFFRIPHKVDLGVLGKLRVQERLLNLLEGQPITAVCGGQQGVRRDASLEGQACRHRLL